MNEPPEPPLDPPQIQYNSHVQYCCIVADSYLCSWQTIHSVQIIIIVSVQYTELLRTVPLIIASGHSLESVNNVHVFLLTFHLCSLFQQWMHQDFASQSKCNALVTSSTFRCAFKEFFFLNLFYKIIFLCIFSIFSSDCVKYLLFPYSCRYDDDIYRQFKRYFKTLKVNIRYFTTIPKKKVKSVKKEAFSS